MTDSGTPLPDRAAEDTDLGWGEVPDAEDPDDVERFLRDRPPHHGG